MRDADSRLVELETRVFSDFTLLSLHVAPTRPREGMMVYADGTDWNPGSGAGIYQYRGSAWVLIG